MPIHNDCKYFLELGFNPRAGSKDHNCCATCHSTMRGEHYYPIMYEGKQYMVCCAMERAVTGITFEQQMERAKLYAKI